MSQQHKTQQTAQVLGQMRVLIVALLAGVLGFAGVAIFLVRTGFESQPELTRPFAVTLVVLGLGLWVVARTAGRALQAKIDEPSTDTPAHDRKRLQTYAGLKLLHGALAEAFGLVGTVFLLVTGEWYFLAAPLISAWLLVRLLPRPDEFGAFAHKIGPGESTHGGAIEP